MAKKIKLLLLAAIIFASVIPIQAASPLRPGTGVPVMPPNVWFEAIYATWEGSPDDVFTAQVSQGVIVEGVEWTDVDAELIRYMGDNTWRVDVPGLAAGGTYNLRIMWGDKEVGERFALDGLVPFAFDRQGYAFYRGEVDGETFPNGTTGGHNPDGTLRADTEIIYVTHDTMYRLAGLSHRTQPTVVRFIGRVGRIGELPPDTNFQHMLQVQNSANITFEGVGHDAVIEGFGILLAETNNVIVRNLTFEHTRHDSVWLRGPSTHGWITHNTFLISGDGSSDIGSGATNFTVSYNRYVGTVQTMLANGNPGEAMHRGTWHNNMFYFTDARHPRLRATQAHIFNNLYINAGQGMAAGERASVISEGNVFINTGTGASFTGRNPEGVMGVSGQGTGGGMAGAEGPGFIISADMPRESNEETGFRGLNTATLQMLYERAPELAGTFGDHESFINSLVPNSFDTASRERFDPYLDNALLPAPDNTSGERNIGGVEFDSHQFFFVPFNPRADLPGINLNVMPAEHAEAATRALSGTMVYRQATHYPEDVPALAPTFYFFPDRHLQQPIISHLNINSDGSFTIRTARSPWATEYIFEWDGGTDVWQVFEDTPAPNAAYNFTTEAGLATPGGVYGFRVTAVNDHEVTHEDRNRITSEPAFISYHTAGTAAIMRGAYVEPPTIIYSQDFDSLRFGSAYSSLVGQGDSPMHMSVWALRFPYMFPSVSGIALNELRRDEAQPDATLSTSLYPNRRRNGAVITDINRIGMAINSDGPIPVDEVTMGIVGAGIDGNALLLRDWNHNNHSDQERYGTVMQLSLGEEVSGRVTISYDFMLNRSAASAGSGFFPVRLYDGNLRQIMARRDNTSTQMRHNHFDPGLNLAYPTWEEHTNRWINLMVALDFNLGVMDIFLDGELYEAGVPIPEGIGGVQYIVASTPTGNHGSQTMHMLIDNIVVAGH